MLRQRQSHARPWLYICGSFIAGAVIAYILISGKRDHDLSWQDLNKQREVLSQQSLTKGQAQNVELGDKKKLLAVLGVQVRMHCHVLFCEPSCLIERRSWKSKAVLYRLGFKEPMHRKPTITE